MEKRFLVLMVILCVIFTTTANAVELPVSNIQPEVSIEQTPLYTYDTVVVLAKIIYGEARGIASQTEQAAIVWCVLNRFDAGYGSTIDEVAKAPYQFAYRATNPTTDDYGRDLIALAQDVLSRWELERNGETDVGRVLPLEYKYYSGWNGHNRFRTTYYKPYKFWDWSLESPYET